MFRIQRLLRPRLTQDTAAPMAALLPALLIVAALGAFSLSARASDAPKATSASETSQPDPKAPVDMDFSQIRIKYQPEVPAYPPEAKAARIQGTVVVSLTIDPSGKVTKAKALSGPPELQTCAVDYAKAWEFHPAKVKGKAVSARFKLTMPFKLK